VVTAVIMIFVCRLVQGGVFQFWGRPSAPTLFVIAISEFFVKYWWLIFGGLGGGFYFFMQAWKRNEKMQNFMDRSC
jgi:type IV pilus assembly protein PilC